MTEDGSPENLRKFLESDDPAMVRMGLSMAKGSGVPEEMLGLVAGLYMWHDDKVVRAAAKSAFIKHAPDELKDILKGTWSRGYGKHDIWNTSYRTVKTEEALKPKVEAMFQRFKDTSLDTVDVWKPALVRTSGDGVSVIRITEGFGAEAVEPLIKALVKDRWWVSSSAADALVRIGKPSVEPLIKTLEGGNLELRKLAARVLGEIGDERAVEQLIKVFGDWDKDVRWYAARALGEIGDGRAVEPLIKAFEGGDLEATYALGEIGDARAVEPLIKVFKNCRKSDKRDVIANALANIGTACAIETLVMVPLDGYGYRARARGFFTTERLKTALAERGLPVSGTEAVLIQRLKAVASKIESTDEIEPLIKDISDKDHKVRMVAAAVLGNLGDNNGIEPLAKAISDKDSTVRMAAATALKKLGWKPSRYKRMAYLFAQQDWKKMGSAGKQSTKFLGTVIDDSSFDVRMAVSGVLQKLGEKDDVKAVELLSKQLGDKAKGVRQAAVKALTAIGRSRVVEPLIKALDDRDIRKDAAKALGDIGDIRAVAPLNKVLENDDTLDVLEVVREALKNLGHEGEDLDEGIKKSAENLRKFLESDDPALRKMGFSMAKGSGVPEDLLPTVLKLYMWDDDKSVRAAAKSVFNKYAPTEILAKVKENWKASYRTYLKAVDYHVEDRFLKVVRPFLEAFKSQNNFAEVALEPLIKALEKKHSGYFHGGSRAALKALVELKWKPETDEGKAFFLIAKDDWEGCVNLGESAVEPLIKALNWQARAGYAAEALGKIGKPAIEPLIMALGNDDNTVRMYAAKALGNIGDERAVKPLIEPLRDEDSSVRMYAAEALGKIGGVAVEPLIKALGDNSSEARRSAALVLGDTGDARAVEPLIKALRDRNGDVSQHAARALGKIGDIRAVEPLIKALGDKRVPSSISYSQPTFHTLRGVPVGLSAMEGLGMIGDARAVEPLIKALEDEGEDVREYAAKALGNIGDARAVEPLIKVLKDKKTYDSMDAVQLKKVLKEKGMTVSGKKTDLIARLKDNDDEDLVAAKEALGNIGEAAVEPLIKTLEDEHSDVRKSAAGVLGKIGDTRAVEPLIKTFKDEKDLVRRAAVAALDALGWEPDTEQFQLERLLASSGLRLSDVPIEALEVLAEHYKLLSSHEKILNLEQEEFAKIIEERNNLLETIENPCTAKELIELAGASSQIRWIVACGVVEISCHDGATIDKIYGAPINLFWSRISAYSNIITKADRDEIVKVLKDLPPALAVHIGGGLYSPALLKSKDKEDNPFLKKNRKMLTTIYEDPGLAKTTVRYLHSHKLSIPGYDY